MEGIFFFFAHLCGLFFSIDIDFFWFWIRYTSFVCFSLFMPIELAVLATAIVHILNNALKFILIRNFIDRAVLISFISAVLELLLVQ